MLRLALTALLSLFLSACATRTPSPPEGTLPIHLTVHKAYMCTCCKGWMNYMESQRFELDTHNYSNLTEVKRQLGVPYGLGSCHTSVTDDGYVFEGHIAARFVREFLANPPAEALGLAVKGMPVGTPGMEYGDRFEPYNIIQINRDGSKVFYRRVNTKAEQFDTGA